IFSQSQNDLGLTLNQLPIVSPRPNVKAIFFLHPSLPTEFTHTVIHQPPWRTIDNYSKAALFFACPTVQSTPRSSLMISPFSFRLQFMAVGLCLFLFRDAAAQNQPTYMQLSPTVKAVLYSPSSSSAARVGVVNMHEDGNRLSDIACTELVKRGFYVLCMNGRSDNNEALDFWN